MIQKLSLEDPLVQLHFLSYRLGDEQTLQQFSRDADEMENWIAEKLQLATEESYKVNLYLYNITRAFIYLNETRSCYLVVFA